MNKSEFDERQVLNRYKIGYQSFFLTLFLLLISGAVQAAGIHFAAPFLTAGLICMLSMLYFTIRVILCDAFYSDDHVVKMNTLMVIYSLISVFETASIFVQIYRHHFQIISNHLLSEDSLTLLITLYFISASVTYWIKRKCDKLIAR